MSFFSFPLLPLLHSSDSDEEHSSCKHQRWPQVGWGNQDYVSGCLPWLMAWSPSIGKDGGRSGVQGRPSSMPATQLADQAIGEGGGKEIGIRGFPLTEESMSTQDLVFKASSLYLEKEAASRQMAGQFGFMGRPSLHFQTTRLLEFTALG